MSGNKSLINLGDLMVEYPKIKENFSTPHSIIMVALRKERSTDSWLNQSLGNWIIAETKRDKIQVIIGIDVASRKVVSIALLDLQKWWLIDNRVHFTVREVLFESNKDDGKALQTLEEALIWNPQNPVRYLN
jgi:hypothetical protein